MATLVRDVQITSFVGSIYEQVAKRIFQGTLHPKRNFKKGELNPDIESGVYDAWIEVKGAQLSRYFMLHPRQLGHYRELLEAPFPYNSLLFAFFGYGLRDLRRKFGHQTIGRLARQILLHTTYLVVIDFAVVEALIPELLKREFLSYGQLFFWSQDINRRLMADPVVELAKLGLDRSRFAVCKKAVEGRLMGRRTVKMIPSVWILQAKSPTYYQ